MGANLHGNGGGRRGRSTRSAGGFNDINITPFVDVMLVLLIIFMVAAPMMTTGVTVNLPKAQASSLPGNDEPVSVSIKRDGKVFVQTTETTVSNRVLCLLRRHDDSPQLEPGLRCTRERSCVRPAGEVCDGQPLRRRVGAGHHGV